MSEARSRWEPPPRFDDFELLGPLGRGGMGHVHLARELSLDREVAIKFIAAENPDPGSVRRFEREARAIAKLTHENVVQVYRVGSVEGRPYLAYELVRGQTLEFHKNALPWDTVLGIGVGIARGLAAVHSAGIVHRDIKPANLMVNDAGVVKLLDFGLAQGQTGSLEPSRGEGHARGVTREGLIAGTPAFMAPELFSGRPATFRSDVFSTGLVLHDLLTGDRSRHGLSLPTLALQAQDGFAPIGSLVPDLPKALCRVIDHCLRVVPYERPDSGMKLRDELEPLAAVLLGRARNLSVDAPETRLVSESLARIWPDLDAFTARLYETLFRERPAYRKLFPPNLDEQRRKLGHALRLAIDGLRTPERIRTSLGDLGRQHRGYGVSPEDLAGLGPFLLATLRQFDAAQWDAELERAWTDAWTFILTAMQSGYGLSEGTLITETHAGLASPRLPTPKTDPPVATEYLETPSTVLAYRHFGSGPHNLVVLPGLLCHLEKAWNGAAEARYLKELGTQGRVLVFDRRGAGLTDRSGGPPSLPEAVEDSVALLEATNTKSAILIAAGDSVPLALTLLAEHPERFRAGILLGGYAKLEVDAKNTGGISKEELDAREAELSKSWGGRPWLERLAPSEVDDEEFVEWFGDYSRASGNPREALRALATFRNADAREVLEEITHPVLLLHRKADSYVPLALGRDLSSKLVRSELVELEGADHLPFAGDQELLLLHLFRFLSSLDFETH